MIGQASEPYRSIASTRVQERRTIAVFCLVLLAGLVLYQVPSASGGTTGYTMDIYRAQNFSLIKGPIINVQLTDVTPVDSTHVTVSLEVSNMRGTMYTLDIYSGQPYAYSKTEFVDENGNAFFSQTATKYPTDTYYLHIDVNVAICIYAIAFVLGDSFGFVPVDSTLWEFAQGVKREFLPDGPYLTIPLGDWVPAIARYVVAHPDTVVTLAAEYGLSYSIDTVIEKANLLLYLAFLAVSSIELAIKSFLDPAEEVVDLVIRAVPSPLSVSVNPNISSGNAPLPVQFSASPSGGVQPYSYAWSFGDGGSSTSQNPSHTYQNAGTYGWMLDVYDSSGQHIQKSGTIQVGSAGSGFACYPVVNPQSGGNPLTVQFSAGCDGGTKPYSYTWTLSNRIDPYTTESFQYTFDNAGTYTWTLTARDSAGHQVQKSGTIQVSSTYGASVNLQIVGKTTDDSPLGGGGGIAVCGPNYTYYCQNPGAYLNAISYTFQTYQALYTIRVQAPDGFAFDHWEVRKIVDPCPPLGTNTVSYCQSPQGVIFTDPNSPITTVTLWRWCWYRISDGSCWEQSETLAYAWFRPLPKPTVTFQSSGIGSDASGTIVTIDGQTYTYSQLPVSFTNWSPGSVHAISASGTVSGGAGKQYVWDSWTKGLTAQSGSYTVPSSGEAVFVKYRTQWQLTMQVNPSGSGTTSPSASSWVWDGDTVQISAIGNSGYRFASWVGSGTGAYTGSANPALMTVNGPVTETASFAQLIVVTATNMWTVPSTSIVSATTTKTSTSYTGTTTTTRTIPTVATVFLLPLTVTSIAQGTQYLTSILTTTITSYTGTETSTSTIVNPTTVTVGPSTSTSTVQTTQVVTSTGTSTVTGTTTTTATSYTGTQTSTSTIVVPTTVTVGPSTSTTTVWTTQVATSTGTSLVTGTTTTTATSYTGTETSTSTIVVPTTVTIVPSTHTVRFTAVYKAGDLFSRNVYYVVDGGSQQLLGTFSTSFDKTFTASYSSSIRVFVNDNPGTVYYEELYVDGVKVKYGYVGNNGLTYPSSAPYQVTFNVNPSSGGLIRFPWGDYSNGQTELMDIDTVSLTAVSNGPPFSGWAYSGGATLSSSTANPTSVTVSGPGSITAMMGSSTSTLTTSGTGSDSSSAPAYLGFLSLFAVTVGRSITSRQGWRIPKLRSLRERRCMRI